MSGRAADRERPRIALITGVPGSGKTTLGMELSRALQIPFLARDDVRRGLFFTAGGWSDRPRGVPTREQAVEVFLTMLETTASLGVSCIAEYVMARERPGDFDRITTAADCVVVVTECANALERFADRHRGDRLINRRPVLDALGYADAEDHTTAALERMQSVAAHLRTDYDVPVLTVHTDDGYDPDLEAIIEFVTA